ncbi:hypothetical protein ACH42_02180 [Endozoicomonas sp. (ex Bugula neritina AB1)]|nr:hypothetical protein ACH42_02180 [Endozoicomonas sp. (ex Bugula neritina AB1)]
MGLGALIVSNPLLVEIARWGGAAFLGWVGFQALCRAFSNDHLEVGQTVVSNRTSVITAWVWRRLKWRLMSPAPRYGKCWMD